MISVVAVFRANNVSFMQNQNLWAVIETALMPKIYELRVNVYKMQQNKNLKQEFANTKRKYNVRKLQSC